MVELLEVRWIAVTSLIFLLVFMGVLSNGSGMESSGVVGVEEPISD